jgi:hypothetical protein
VTTFTKTSPGTYDPETDSYTGGTETTVEGSAIKIKDSASSIAKYQALGLVLTDAITLLFTAEEYGDHPEVGSTVEWASQTYTVRSVETLAPDGVTILSYLTCSR